MMDGAMGGKKEEEKKLKKEGKSKKNKDHPTKDTPTKTPAKESKSDMISQSSDESKVLFWFIQWIQS